MTERPVVLRCNRIITVVGLLLIGCARSGPKIDAPVFLCVRLGEDRAAFVDRMTASAHVRQVCDLNRDGRREILVSAPGYGGTRGAVWAVSSEDGDVLLSAEGRSVSNKVDSGTFFSGEFLGKLLGPVGDLDGDGCEDLAFGGRRGSIIVVRGAGKRDVVRYMPTSDGVPQHLLTGVPSGPRVTSLVGVCGLSDVTGDGIGELVIAYTVASRQLVLEVQDGSRASLKWRERISSSLPGFAGIGDVRILGVRSANGDPRVVVAWSQMFGEQESDACIIMLEGATGKVLWSSVVESGRSSSSGTALALDTATTDLVLATSRAICRVEYGTGKLLSRTDLEGRLECAPVSCDYDLDGDGVLDVLAFVSEPAEESLPLACSGFLGAFSGEGGHILALAGMSNGCLLGLQSDAAFIDDADGDGFVDVALTTPERYGLSLYLISGRSWIAGTPVQ